MIFNALAVGGIIATAVLWYSVCNMAADNRQMAERIDAQQRELASLSTLYKELHEVHKHAEDAKAALSKVDATWAGTAVDDTAVGVLQSLGVLAGDIACGTAGADSDSSQADSGGAD